MTATPDTKQIPATVRSLKDTLLKRQNTPLEFEFSSTDKYPKKSRVSWKGSNDITKY